MNSDRLQSLVSRGYGRAACQVGLPSQLVRPVSVADPLKGAIVPIMATFSADAAFSFQKPPLQDKPQVFGLFNTDDILPGDMIVNADGIYFVERVELWRPPVCILTNAVVSLTETSQSGSGALDDTGAISAGACSLAGLSDPYGIAASSSATGGTGSKTIAINWPAYIGPPKRGLNGASGVSGTVRASEYVLLLPPIPGYVPLPYMKLTDAHGRSYTISGATTSQYGSECLMTVNQI
ncbi:hypothetical protein [Acetobacter aceti]|uniref:Uncharacterized protein n=1 Tax=Acetobacter aceti TaxID=435 RepID=A0A6S6PTP0_ACEAC|nr:hypothetical protein [Acetobacter aceti]BCI68092.1 hypothetical protein AAJCM20276_27160 [Acetobacter aceti]